MRISTPSALAVVLLASLSTVAGAGEAWRYAVKPGDNLIDIAQAYLATPSDWPKLQELNKVPEPRHLVPGTQLSIPVAWLRRQAALAEVVRVQGGAARIANGAAHPLAPGDKLAAGETVTTEAGANVTLRFVDGSRLLVAQRSRLTLAHMQVFGATGMAQTMLRLNGGSVETQVAHQRAPAARYEIQSEALNLGVRGTDFRVGVDENGLTRSEVLAGRVMAKGKAVGVALDAGYGTLAAPGQAPLPAIRLLDAPDLGGLPARLERLPLRFAWKSLPGAVKYRAQVCADQGCGQLLLDGEFAAPVAKWADLPDGTYHFRVRALDAHALEGWNAERTFVLKARPEPPFITTPQDGKNAYGDQTSFRWAAVEGAPRYHFQLSDSADFTRPLIDLPDLTHTEHTAALAPGQYHWRIASIRLDGDQGPYSDVQSFTQRKIPESPTPSAPALDDKVLAWTWKAGEAGQTFHVQLARDKAFTQLVSDTDTAEPRFALARPEAGHYFMRVKTIDSDGFAGPFGPAQEIDVPSAFPGWLLLLVPIALAL